MRPTHRWHHTPFGKAALWLGSIELAVPVLTLVALALAWGTYVESTTDGRTARATVYGSWWFIAVMALICVSLIFAVITRYPWKRRHVGFITVHASLVTMIFAGFWSLFGRVEGHMTIEEGATSGSIEMEHETLELVEHDAGQFRTIGSMDAPWKPGRYTIGGFPFEVVEVWNNVKEEFEITDDGADPYRAVQIQFGPAPESAVWIGDEARGPAPVVDRLRIRVLASGSQWQPPKPGATAAGAPAPAAGSPAASTDPATSGYTFVIGEKSLAVPKEGDELIPGWRVVSVKRFTHAMVGNDGLVDDPNQDVNPAMEVVLADGQGSREQHRAFENFPDMVLTKTLEGSASSGARLAPPATARAAADPHSPHSPQAGHNHAAPAQPEETLVIYGEPPALNVGYISADGSVKTLTHTGTLPWTADFGARKVTFVKQFSRAREQSRFVQGPPAKDRRPAMVIRTAQGAPAPLAWKAMVPFALPGRTAILRLRPTTVTLPFAVKLDDFRKVDYPGIDMAMSYESAVTVTSVDGTTRPFTISMNNPLVESGWKVYQSGFLGEGVTVLSVMRDPGLILTYISCTTLCIGIVITFYARGLAGGHPGIPALTPRNPFAKEHPHAPVPAPVPSAAPSALRPADLPHPVVTGAGTIRSGPGLDAALVGAAGAGRRPGNAA